MPKHKLPEALRYRGPAKWCQYVLARGLLSALQVLPVSMSYRFGRGLGWVCWKSMKRRRAIVRKNLEIVNAWMAAQAADGRPEREEDGDPGSGPPASLPLEAQVREVFQRSGANLMAGFPLSRLSGARMRRHIEITGVEHLREALSQGKGAIVLLAHMGPWEALAHLPGLMAEHGVHAPHGAMYRPLNNAYLDDWIRIRREARGTRLFSRRDGFHKPVDFLRAGGILGILADQKMRQGVAAPFFGRTVMTSPIPGLFHRRSGAPMLAVSVQTVGSRLWCIRFAPVALPPRIDLSDRRGMATVCNQALEAALSISPVDGFWFQKRA